MFRYFDQDFDGIVSKSDMRVSLAKFCGFNNISDINIDRLFRMLSFYKTESLQPSDFFRLLVEDVNPILKFGKADLK